MDLSFRNTSATIANIFALDADVQIAVVQLVHKAGEFCRELTYFLAPVDTSFMRDNIRVTFGPKGYTFEVGWLEEDFIAAGLAFYPIYQEFGTRFMAAQPSLVPAYNETKEWFLPALSAEIQAAAARRTMTTS